MNEADISSLEGKLAMVTGAAGVLGHATARTLAADGLTVIMTDVDEPRLREYAAAIGTAAVPMKLDVSDPQAVAATAQRIRSDHGSLDVLVNNAGILSNNKAAETTPEEWRRLMSINLDGAFYLAREWLGGMTEKGGDSA